MLGFSVSIQRCTGDWLRVDCNFLRAASFGYVQYCTLFAGNAYSES
jgi:hypothetical protein